jgi:transcriptional regulator with XRE-family HTH domain
MCIFVIKPIRKKKNLTLYELSKRTGISRTYLRNLENNKQFNPTMFILKKISEVLEVNIKDLFYSQNDIEILKQEMYHRIDKYGLDSKEVMEISQIIDLLINVKMKKTSH